MMLAQLRHYDYMLEDPLIDSWLDTLGTRLAANSDRPRQPFTFFMLRERQINAFATLGGYVGMNSGLVLAAEREDEVAGVLSHEIAHVTQQHVLRGGRTRPARPVADPAGDARRDRRGAGRRRQFGATTPRRRRWCRRWA